MHAYTVLVPGGPKSLFLPQWEVTVPIPHALTPEECLRGEHAQPLSPTSLNDLTEGAHTLKIFTQSTTSLKEDRSKMFNM